MIKDGQEFRVIDENCWSPVARLADMNKTGWTIKSWQTHASESDLVYLL